MDTETDTIDTRVTIGGKPRCRDRLRVDFERHFAIGRDVECVLAGTKDAVHVIRFEEGRGAAAEVDGVGPSIGVRPRVAHRGQTPDLSHQSVHVALLECPVEQASIEIAVVADRRTERDVEVKTERRIW